MPVVAAAPPRRRIAQVDSSPFPNTVGYDSPIILNRRDSPGNPRRLPMPVSLLSEVSTVIRSMFTQRRNTRRRAWRGVVTESLESRQLLAAVISPIVDYNTNAAGVALSSNSVQLNDDVIVFSTSTLEHGSELWRSDGTADGTFRLTDNQSGPQNSAPDHLTRFGNEVYFSLRSSDSASYAVELWKTDGTVAGTRRVRDFS